MDCSGFQSDLTNLVDSSPNVKEVLTNHGHSAVDGILRVSDPLLQ